METSIESKELTDCTVTHVSGRNTLPGIVRVNVSGVEIGGPEIIIMAGPCAVESMDQLVETAVSVKRSNAKILRGGAFKPRFSPHSFQGLGEQALKMLHEISKQTGLPVVTEVMDIRQIDTVCKYADMLQIVSRKMQNFPLLK